MIDNALKIVCSLFILAGAIFVCWLVIVPHPAPTEYCDNLNNEVWKEGVDGSMAHALFSMSAKIHYCDYNVNTKRWYFNETLLQESLKEMHT